MASDMQSGCDSDADPSPELCEDPYQFFESWEARHVSLVLL